MRACGSQERPASRCRHCSTSAAFRDGLPAACRSRQAKEFRSHSRRAWPLVLPPSGNGPCLPLRCMGCRTPPCCT